MRKNKQIVSFILTLTMVISLIPMFGVTAFAATDVAATYDGETQVNTYSDIFSAVEAASDGALKVKLLGDITMTQPLVISAGAFVKLDLDGHILSGNNTDTVIINNGQLTIEGGTQSVHNFEICSDGVWKVTDAAATTNLNLIKGYTTKTAVVPVTGGCITGGGNDSITGGGINNQGHLTVSGISIIGNKAYSGGGIYNDCASISVINCFIEGNKASGSGGGVFSKGSISSANTFISESSIENNFAGYGGGIFNFYNGADAKLSLYSACIRNNNAEQEAGGIDNQYGSITMSSITIEYNSAATAGGGFVGCVLDSNLIDVKAINNTAISYGGIVFYGSLRMQGASIISENIDNGGSSNLCVMDTASSVMPVMLSDISNIGVTLIDSATDETTVGAISATGAEFADCFFSDNKAYSLIPSGEALYLIKECASVEDNGTTTYFDTVQDAIDFASASAIGNAKTVKLLRDIELSSTLDILSPHAVKLDLNGKVLDGNGSGSVIQNTGTLVIEDSNPTVHNFETCLDGVWKITDGAVTASLDSISTPITQVEVVPITGGCITDGNDTLGGGIRNSGNLTISGILIIGNKDSGSYGGGGILNKASSNANVTLNAIDCLIIGNKALNGGGIDHSQGDVSSLISGCSIKYNTADYGGGIANDGLAGSNVVVIGTIIKGNSAVYAGGGVFNCSNYFTLYGTLMLRGVAIESNDAMHGGGIVNYNAGISLIDTSVSDNTGITAGGFELAGDGGVTLSGNSLINNNTASGKSSNLCLVKDSYGSINVVTPSALSDSADIGISVLYTDMMGSAYETTVGAISATGASFLDNFTSDISSWSVAVTSDGKGLEIVSAAAFTVNFDVDGLGGSVDVDYMNNVPEGTVISKNGNALTVAGRTVTATPSTGYKFKEWSSAGYPAGGVVDAATTIFAVFEAESTNTPSSGDGGGSASAATTTTAAVTTTDAAVEVQFDDVSKDDYFYDAVKWAVANNITNGMKPTLFKPYAGTTRAQMVTFLWRAAGSPEPTTTSCPFKDVVPGSWYEKAVLWAVEKGITNGMRADRFGVNDVVTRAQAVTFLWRYEGAVKFANMTASGPAPSPFDDVANDAYYYDAVLWARAQGITDGKTDSLFAPADGCTRAQVVAFLWRDIVK